MSRGRNYNHPSSIRIEERNEISLVNGSVTERMTILFLDRNISSSIPLTQFLQIIEKVSGVNTKIREEHFKMQTIPQPIYINEICR